MMGLEEFANKVTSHDELRQMIGTPGELAIRKQLAELDKHMRAFIAQAPFALLATYGSDGRCDVSPRGDRPAVAKVLDSKTLVLPDRPGNRRADSLQNIIDTGQIGLLFLIPGLGETLRVNGSACVIRDDPVLSEFAVSAVNTDSDLKQHLPTAHSGDGNPQQVKGKTKLPTVAIAVEVQECYLQCAKAIIRSKLWAPDSLNAPSLCSFAEILIAQTQADETVEKLDQMIQQSYSERLY